MARHLIAPTGAPGWGRYAYGLVGVPEGSELELHVVSVEDPFNAADLALLAAQEGSSSSSAAMAYLVVIYDGLVKIFDGLTAFFTGEDPSA